MSEKSLKSAYIIWALTGLLGGHRYYLGRYLSAIAFTLTLGAFGIGWIIDGIRMHAMVDESDFDSDKRKDDRCCFFLTFILTLIFTIVFLILARTLAMHELYLTTQPVAMLGTTGEITGEFQGHLKPDHGVFKHVFFKYEWTFSDNTTKTTSGPHTSHTFKGAGWHNATLTWRSLLPGNSITSNVTVSWYSLGNNTVIIPENSVQPGSNNTFMSLVWPDHIVPPATGNIIAGNDIGGFTHTIINVITYDNSSRLTSLTVGNATIADVFSDAFIDGMTQFDDSSNSNNNSSDSSSDLVRVEKARSKNNIKRSLLSNQNLKSGGGGNASSSASISFDPTLEFTPNLYHRVVISGHSFQELTLVAEGELTMGFLLNVQTSDSLTITPWSYEYSPPTILGIILLPVVNIPLVVNWHVTIGVSLSVSLKESFSMGATDSFNAKLGASYTKENGFTSISSFNSNPVVLPFNHSSSCTSSISTTLGAGITFTMFGITPQLAIDMTGGLQLTRGFNTNPYECSCISATGDKQVYNSLNFVYGPSISLSLLIFSKSWDIAQQTTNLAATCDKAITNCGDCYCPYIGGCCPWTTCPWYQKYQCLCMSRYDGKGICATNAYCVAATCRTNADCAAGYSCTISQNCNPKNQCSQNCGPQSSSMSISDSIYNNPYDDTPNSGILMFDHFLEID
ncbi:hypothetical protein PPL_08317 [Heterostelium album PN500]|uniref:PKD domain-containing protein n=1 Tax=Heterostelium pallidum (strain ATCC 26659 / Pp 5 / PN500) TaxID=670386 RepID=D3BHV1_HETP5|nr:hypothetical protein PPL_08317 [Heterostelium album PN500]EFA78851.1 hypothetical protein PPL_08317 [Heterostelium album PN500]|eukprot:XP_020430975.1 hypothetical protein PPL_08317 [Heterostelium album PN500]